MDDPVCLRVSLVGDERLIDLMWYAFGIRPQTTKTSVRRQRLWDSLFRLQNSFVRGVPEVIDSNLTLKATFGTLRALGTLVDR